MKPLFARVALLAGVVCTAGVPALAAEEPVQSYDAATSTLSDLIRQAEENIRKVDHIIEQQKVAERNALRDTEARRLYEQGDLLYASGDLEGAKKAWAEALRVASNPEMKSHIADQQRKADERAAAERARRAEEERLAAEKARQQEAALKARKREMFAQGKGLFDSGNLDAAETKFRELLALDADYPKTKEYVDSRIPERREELRRQAEKESKARAAFEQGNVLFAKGDLAGARAAWNDALRIADNRVMREDIERKEASAAIVAAPAVKASEPAVVAKAALPTVVKASAPVAPLRVEPAAPAVKPEVKALKAVTTGGRFVLAKGPKGVPEGEGVSSIPGSTKRVYYVSDRNSVAGERITHVWEYQGKVVSRFRVGLVGKTMRSVWSVKGMPAGSTGTWTVRTVTADGRELSADSFNYENE